MFSKVLAAAALALVSSPGLAAPIVFNGYDSGTGDLASSPTATAAAAAFDAALAVFTTTDFETAPTALTVSGFSAAGDCGAALCGYNTTVAGAGFVRGYGTFTFAFASAINAFGGYFTGWQVGSQTITYTDGSTEVLDMGSGGSGGTRFFGFIDAGKSIASLTYNTCAGFSCDIVGIDDVRTGAAAVPLPAGLPLLGAALGGLAFLRRRARKG